MNLGYELTTAAAKQSVDPDEAPTRESMRGVTNAATRRKPTTDEKKVRRQLSKKASSLDNCPVCGKRITDTDDAGMEADDGQRWCIEHAPDEIKPKEGSTMNPRQREVEILRAMAKADLPEQRRLAQELDQLRARTASQVRTEREVDLGDTVIRDRLTPVATHERSTVGTDWLDEVVATATPSDFDHAMRTEATLWFDRLHEAVRADAEEFTEQARGMARRTAGRYGEAADAAALVFLETAARLRRNAGTDASDQNGNAESTVTDYDTRADQDPWLAEDWEDDGDLGVHPPMPGAGEAPNSIPTPTASSRTASVEWTEGTAPSGATYFKATKDGYSLDIRPLREGEGTQGAWSWSVTGNGDNGPRNSHGQAMNRSDAESIALGIVENQHAFTLESRRVTASDIATCGNCGLSWDDSISTSWTPVPSGRCPFEYFHEYDEDDEAIELEPEDIPDDFAVQPIGKTGSVRKTASDLVGSRKTAGNVIGDSLSDLGAKLLSMGLEFRSVDYEGEGGMPEGGGLGYRKIEIKVDDGHWHQESVQLTPSTGQWIVNVPSWVLEANGITATGAAEGQTCSVCGDKIAKDPASEDPQTWHHDNGEKHDHEAKPSSDSKESRRTTANARCDKCGETWGGDDQPSPYLVNGTRRMLHAECADNLRRDHEVEKTSARKVGVALTNVGVDPDTGNGTGTDPDGNKVQFKLTDKERSDLKAILLSDLAINFSGVTVDEGDIIKDARRRVAGGEKCQATTTAHIGNQYPMEVKCIRDAGHEGQHKGITLDSDDNAITYTFSTTSRRRVAGNPDGPTTQDGSAESALPTPENDPTVAWPWELTEEERKALDAANVANVPTPGGESGYPQPTTSARTRAFAARVQAGLEQRGGGAAHFVRSGARAVPAGESIGGGRPMWAIVNDDDFVLGYAMDNGTGTFSLSTGSGIDLLARPDSLQGAIKVLVDHESWVDERSAARRTAARNDPYWLDSVRYPGVCSKCGTAIPKGARAWYWPLGKKLECEACGTESARRFQGDIGEEMGFPSYGSRKTAVDFVVPEGTGARDFVVEQTLAQIGTMNVLAISGGRVNRITGSGGRVIGISLPVSQGYVVNVFLANDDTYVVQRVFRGKVKAEVRNVYADEIGEVAYRAGMYHDPFPYTGSRRQAMPNPVDFGIKVGDIFYDSWGYDQTQVDFYEVTGLTGASVRVRPVAQRIVKDSGPYTEVVAIPGSYTGGEETKRLLGGSSPNDSLAIKTGYNRWAFLWDGTPRYATGWGFGH